MTFNPTNDYCGLDTSVEPNSVIWDFWEFVKNLVLLSSPASIQKETIGLGHVIYNSNDFSDYKLLTKNQIKHINKLDLFFGERSGGLMPDFWDDELLDSHPDWQKVRTMAKKFKV